jgi:hypothetical protein
VRYRFLHINFLVSQRTNFRDAISPKNPIYDHSETGVLWKYKFKVLRTSSKIKKLWDKKTGCQLNGKVWCLTWFLWRLKFDWSTELVVSLSLIVLFNSGSVQIDRKFVPLDANIWILTHLVHESWPINIAKVSILTHQVVFSWPPLLYII